MEQADLLFLIMGTNPFPNIIAAITRVKEKGEIICLCTKETEGQPYKRFSMLLNERLKLKNEINKILVDVVDSDSIERVLRSKLDSKLNKENGDITIELNYTGGTKVIMAATAYNVMKNYSKKNLNYKIGTILSYIDAERECLYYECREDFFKDCRHKTIKLKELKPQCNLKVYDIISAYNNINKMNEKSAKTTLDNEEFSQILGNLFVNIDRGIYDYRISFFDSIFNIAKGKGKEKDTEKEGKIRKIFKDSSIPVTFDSFEQWNFKNKEHVIKYFENSIWFEEYVLKILLELKDEKVLLDVVGNVSRKKGRGNKADDKFEIDMVAYRNYKLFAISVTTIDTIEEARGKLYEIRQRAKDLAGDEAGMCYITLCWNTEELEQEYKNIWDGFKPKNTLIIGVDKFSNLKEEIKEWIMEGEKYE